MEYYTSEVWNTATVTSAKVFLISPRSRSFFFLLCFTFPSASAFLFLSPRLVSNRVAWHQHQGDEHPVLQMVCIHVRPIHFASRRRHGGPLRPGPSWKAPSELQISIANHRVSQCELYGHAAAGFVALPPGFQQFADAWAHQHVRVEARVGKSEHVGVSSSGLVPFSGIGHHRRAHVHIFQYAQGRCAVCPS